MSKQREELVKHLVKNYDCDRWEELIGPIHWRKLNSSFKVHSGNQLSETIASNSSCNSEKDDLSNPTAGDVSSSRKRKTAIDKKNRFLPNARAKKRNYQRNL